MEHYLITGVLDPNATVQMSANGIHIVLPLHLVRVLNFIDKTVADQLPVFIADHPDRGLAGNDVDLSIQEANGDSALSCHWDSGDGVGLEGEARKIRL
jgi:hypothetical protein